MRVAYEAFYLIQWLIYLLRLVLSLSYGVFQFIAKPGSRYIVPVIAAVVCYCSLASIENGLFAHGRSDIEPWAKHVVVVGFFLIAWLAYVLVSRAVAVVIGTFPKVTRPLPPLRRLRPTNLKIKSAVVQLAVPKLRF